MAFPESFLEEVREKNPIEEVVGQYVTLTRRGSNLFGLCPFHNEKTASFSVVPAKSMYYCFGCHKGGGVINFIMEIEGLDYPDAVRNLAARAGITVPEDDSRQESSLRRKEQLWALCRDAARHYHGVLRSPEGKEGLDYLRSRGLSAETITRFGLGFAPNRWDSLKNAMLAKGYTEKDLLDAGLLSSGESRKQPGKRYSCDRFRNRVMFPIIDVRGNVIGFGGRIMGSDENTAKYLNSPETLIFNKRKNLFALNAAKKTKRDMLVLTEGYMDTITMHQYGFDCAVASLGTSLTEEQAKLISRYTKQLVLCYDGDAAGQSAAKRAIGILEETGVAVRVLRMQGAKDPDEFLKKYGAERFQKLLGASESQNNYQLESIRRKYDLTADDQKVSFLREAAELVSGMSSAGEREVYAARAAEMAGITADAMKIEVSRAYNRKKRAKEKNEEKKKLQPARTYRSENRALRIENPRSAVAEEGLLNQILLEPTLLRMTASLAAENFSVELWGRVYAWMCARHQEGLEISVGAMAADFTPEELAQLARISGSSDATVNEKAVRDYVDVILTEKTKKSGRDVMEVLSRKRNKAVYGG